MVVRNSIFISSGLVLDWNPWVIRIDYYLDLNYNVYNMLLLIFISNNLCNYVAILLLSLCICFHIFASYYSVSVYISLFLNVLVLSFPFLSFSLFVLAIIFSTVALFWICLFVGRNVEFNFVKKWGFRELVHTFVNGPAWSCM